ncbi:MAG TPA: CocE/NonD family hydrolase, partial [Thermoleophilaceae bacterium]|nr:CocE/NonD family hydrolase [Thermoleophilaceae bacterium]
AARRPAPLRAIVPIVGMTDPGGEWAHPNGALGGHSFARFGLLNLMMQLLPPIARFHSTEEQRRWFERLDATEPYIVDLFRHGPTDPVWSNRAVDAAEISVPALCFSGWRDSLCDSTVRAYERLRGPKRLIMGPWTHTMPHASPFEPIDFLWLALRWWDQWLRGIETGIMDEPPVALYVQGRRPGWRGYDSWPPGSEAGLNLVSDPAGVLALRDGADGAHASAEIGRYEPDPTVGALSGLWGISTGGIGLPLDQQADDARSFCVTSEGLERDVLIVGRPRVVLELAGPARRIVARLADVDERGRSSFIAGGIVVPRDEAARQEVELWPTCYRVSAGHRLRVVVSDAAFPRLWPLADAEPIGISALELFAPTVRDEHGCTVSFPRPSQTGPAMGATFEGDWRITHDLVADALEVVVGHKSMAHTPAPQHALGSESSIRAAVGRRAPQAAKLEITENATARLETGERIAVTTGAQLTSETLWVKGEVEIDDMLIFSRVWRERRASQPNDRNGGC